MSAALLAALGEPVDCVITLDAETFYDAKYHLRAKDLSTADYVTDDRFELIGMGVKIGARPAVWLEAHEFEAWARTVDWSRCGILAHNTAFDGAILSWRYGIKPGFWFDTLSLGKLLHGTDVGGSLGKLSAHYGVGVKGDEVNAAKGKHRADFTAEEYARYGAYCANDCELTYRLLWKMIEEAPEKELWVIDSTLRFYLEPKFVGDEAKLARAVEDERAKKEALLARVSASRDVLMSNEQFAALLSDMGVEPPMKFSAKKTATARKKDPNAEEVWTFAFAKGDPGFKELLEHENDEIRWLAEARVGVKSTGTQTRAQRLLNMSRRGPLPVYLKYHGAHTGRWAAGDKTNFQNLERTNKRKPEKGAIRKALLAPEGHVVVAADSGAIEARTLAWLAEHSALVEAFAQKRDVYSEFASIAYGRKVDRKANPADEIPGHVGKTCVLGLGYSMGAAKLATSLLAGANGGPPVQFTMAEASALRVDIGELAEDEYHVKRVRGIPTRLAYRDMFIHYAVSKHLVDTYREENAPIPKFWATLERALSAMYAGKEFRFGPNGCLRTAKNGIVLPSGRMLRYAGLSQDERGRYTCWGGQGGRQRVGLYGGKLVENVCQSFARDIIAEQLLWVRVEKYDVATTTHDEIVPIVPEVLGAAATKRVLEIMHVAPDWAPGLALSAEGGFNRAYGLAK